VFFVIFCLIPILSAFVLCAVPALLHARWVAKKQERKARERTRKAFE
tara:strand:+ start:632 stop:772 length:141 start_codon:yes stop_codon:yes gene_type:complete